MTKILTCSAKEGKFHVRPRRRGPDQMLSHCLLSSWADTYLGYGPYSPTSGNRNGSNLAQPRCPKPLPTPDRFAPRRLPTRATPSRRRSSGRPEERAPPLSSRRRRAYEPCCVERTCRLREWIFVCS